VAKVALFDLDNTLVDRCGAFSRWASDFVTERGLGVAAADILRELDRDGFASRHALFTAARTRLGLDDSVERLTAEYRHRYPAYFEPDRGVQDALARLRADGWRLGVVTNGPPTQREKIARAGLAALVDGVVISEEVGTAKPEPEIFEEALRRCGVDRAAGHVTWMLGDTPGPDIGGGRALGFRTAWFHRGRTWPEHDFRPDAVVADMTEAARLLSAQGAP
jgi:HAD superfamily hydrolase (TIGR01549 family)